MLKVQEQRPYRRGQRQPTAAELAVIPELLRGAGRQVDQRA